MNVENRTIFQGDNLEIMQGIDDETIDLIYLDPPFNSNRIYESPLDSEVRFDDTWQMSDLKDEWLGQLADEYPNLYRLIDSAVCETAGNSMKAYQIFMAVRFIQIHRVLTPNGSVFLHCDDTAVHYLKPIMDAIFKPENYRNEIVWERTKGKNNAKTKLPRVKDCILWYSKTKDYTFNRSAIEVPYNRTDNLPPEVYNLVEEGTGRRYKLGSLHPYKQEPGSDRHYEVMGVTKTWRWSKERMQKAIDDGLIVQTKPGATPKQKLYLDERVGRLLTDIWTDIPNVRRPVHKTQKPIKLLQRIISMASHTGDVVLDPFCGSSTTCIAAESLQRQWIGIEESENVFEVSKKRFKEELNLDLEDGILGKLHARTDVPERMILPDMFRQIYAKELFSTGSMPDHELSMEEEQLALDIKQTLFGKQRGRCVSCEKVRSFRELTIEHKLPKSKFPELKDDFSNLELKCFSCNVEKGSKPEEFLREKLKSFGVEKGDSLQEKLGDKAIDFLTEILELASNEDE